jgi:hypothetical protein
MRFSALARLGLSAWFFGNLYEATVGMPELTADAPPRGLLAPGSPVRYYAPLGPATLAATAATLVDGWRTDGNKPAIIVTAAGTVSAVALSGYLISTINVRLIRTSPSGAERERLVGRWHRVNGVRLGALAVALIALRQASRH